MHQTRFQLQSHIDHLYHNSPRELAFQAASREEFSTWKNALRSKLPGLLGIDGRARPVSPYAEKLGAIDRGNYIEEKYALDVGEGVDAPMYILIPKSEPPYKPILVFHGHDPNVQYILGNYPDEESAELQIQLQNNYAQALACAGYLVCAVEQRGFGERVSDQTGEGVYPRSCRHLAFEYLMEGRTLLGERCWDGMVALSYLKRRDDVIPGVMGCTGNSGGGTTALWLSALDERITVSVVASYLCSFKHSILGMTHCECNYVPGILQYTEMGELAAMIAPRPFLAIAGERDPIYPIEGVRQQFETVKRAYDLLGLSGYCSLSIHPDGHRYDNALSSEWFRRWL